MTLGRCRKECLAKLPVVPNAAPTATEQPAEGWLSGRKVDGRDTNVKALA